MANPLDTAGQGSEFEKIMTALTGLSEEQLHQSMRLAAASKKANLKVPYSGSNPDRKQKAMTIRFLPEMHKIFMEVGDEMNRQKGPLTSDVKRRASTTFSAALTNGQVIIELKDGKRRSAYATPEMAKKIEDHTIELSNGHGTTKTYDKVNVVDQKSFQQLANAFLRNLQPPGLAKRQTTIEDIKAAQSDDQSAPPSAPNIVVQTADKKVSIGKPKAETVAAQKADPVKAQEKNIEEERHALVDKKKAESEILNDAQAIKEHETEKADGKLAQNTLEAKTDLPPTIAKEPEDAPQNLPQDLPSALPEKG